MIEDQRHLQILDDLARELQRLINQHNAKTNGKTDKQELCDLRLAQIEELMELLRQQRRAIEHMAGRPVTPEVQFGEAIVIGTMGGAT